MRQRAHLFQPLEVTETMRAYVAHNMDRNEDLLASLEMTRNEAVVVQNLSEEGVGLLRKADEKKDVSQAEAWRLTKEKATIATHKEKVEEEVIWLRQEL